MLKDHVHLVLSVPPRVVKRSAKSIDIGTDGIFERQYSNRSVQTYKNLAETILRKSFLEARLLRNDDRVG